MNMKLDYTQKNSILSEEVWRKSGNSFAHLKPGKAFDYIYKGKPLTVIGEASIHLVVAENDFVPRVLVCRRLELDGVLGTDFKEEHDRIVGTSKVLNDRDSDEANECALKELLQRNTDLFAEKVTDLCSSSTVKHRIDTRDAQPIKQVPQRLPFHLRTEIGNTVTELRESGVIVPSKSDWAANIVPVRKKDGTIRLCVDYRDVNDLTVKDCYPVPRIDDTIDKFHNVKEFTTLDCFAGYYQVLVHEEDRHKTAFTTPFGLFEYVRMPFGLCNAPATFQRLMDQVLEGLVGKICLVYLDDIIVYSKNKEEHLRHIQLVFDRLRQNNLKLKVSKCHFMKPEVQYLGHVVNRHGLFPQQSKLDILASFPRPTTIVQLQSFIGLASYYRRFIANFSMIASVLHQAAASKNKKLVWNDACQTAFDTLKNYLTSDTILVFPDFKQLFRLETDDCNYGVGAVLSQKREKRYQPVAYWSRHLNKAQQNYSTIEKEALAIVMAVKHFRVYLYGQKFVIATDHQALKWLNEMREPQPRLARWIIELGEYDYEIEYKSGKTNGNADALSRIPTEDKPLEVDYEMEERLCAVSIATGSQREEQMKDEAIKTLIEWKENHETRPDFKADAGDEDLRILWLQWKRLKVVNGVLYREYTEDDSINLQFIVPKLLRVKIMGEIHDSWCGGHLGQDKTLGKLDQRYYWPRITKELKKYIQSCDKCAMNKTPREYARAPLKPIRATHPFELVTSDVQGPFPLSKLGNKYIVTFHDSYTKWVEIYAIPNQLAETIADKLMEFISRHSVPEALLTDQGRNYESNLFREALDLLDCHKVRTSAYHPECDGLSERFNRTYLEMVRLRRPI